MIIKILIAACLQRRVYADDVRCAAANYHLLVWLDILRDFPEESNEELRQVQSCSRMKIGLLIEAE